MEKLILQILLYAVTFMLGWALGMERSWTIIENHNKSNDRERSNNGRE